MKRMAKRIAAIALVIAMGLGSIQINIAGMGTDIFAVCAALNPISGQNNITDDGEQNSGENALPDSYEEDNSVADLAGDIKELLGNDFVETDAAEDVVSENSIVVDSILEEDILPEEDVATDVPQQESVSGNAGAENTVSGNAVSGNDLESEIALLADYDAANSLNIPQSVDELDPTKEYYDVKTYDDLLALQALSRQSSLAGYNFRFEKLDSVSNAWDLTNIGFTGLGSEEYPFRGRIWEYFTSGTSFRLNTPLFQYLGSGASMENFALYLDGASSGIAQNLILDDDTPLDIRNVTLTGSVVHEEGTAGAAFGKVVRTEEQEYVLTVDNQEIAMSNMTVAGVNAGGYIGEMSGKVTLKVLSGEGLAGTVTSTASHLEGAAGGIVGSMGKDSKLSMEQPITINSTVTGGRNCGGIVGQTREAVISALYGIVRNGDVQGLVYAGGFAGLLTDSYVQIDGLNVNGDVEAYYRGGGNTEAGGVIGRYVTTKEDGIGLEISRVGISNRSVAGGNEGASATGGIIGVVNGNKVTISKIHYNDGEYAFLPDMRFSGADGTRVAMSVTGGIIGRMYGQYVSISDVDVAFVGDRTLAGSYVGDIVGYMSGAKARLTDIKVSSHYSYYNANCDGGIVGCVDKGSILALCGTVDLSALPYTYTRTTVYGTNRGYVAGQQTESIIYLEQGAQLIRNAVANNPADSVWLSEGYRNPKSYLLNDIGGYGGIYQNVSDADNTLVIQYDRSYGQEITGTIDTNSANGKLVLENTADALRLAIALNTFDASEENYALRFAGNCFESAVNGKQLLSADYEVTGDLNLQEAGIVSLCRNDKDSVGNYYAFSGSMSGVQGASNQYPVITEYLATKTADGGLFPKVENASFSGLTLTGILYYPVHAGGIAPYAEGSLTLENITTTIEIWCCPWTAGGINFYFGGLVGRYDIKDGIFRMEHCNISPIMRNIRVDEFNGGAVGGILVDAEGAVPVQDNVVIRDIRIGGVLEAGGNFAVGNAGGQCYARVGGLVAFIGYNPSVGANMNSGNVGTLSDKIFVKMELSDISIDNASIHMVTKAKYNSCGTGGFLGYDWSCVDVVSRNIKVKDSAIEGYGAMGGLLKRLGGRITFDGVELDGLTMKGDSDTPFTYSAFLVGDARYGWITLLQSNYIIHSNVKAENFKNFDEIAGVTFPLKYVNTQGDVPGRPVSVTSEIQGTRICYWGSGVVNIIMPEFKKMARDGYSSYRNQVITDGVDNPYTRYYYNLLDEDYDDNHIEMEGNQLIIDSPEKVMIWYLLENANSYIKPFVEEFAPSAWRKATKCVFKGELDMRGYSIYPSYGRNAVTYSGEENATFIYYGEDIEDWEQNAKNKAPSVRDSQHYAMHAGLFTGLDVVSVSNLTFRGTAANIGEESGVLCSNAWAGWYNGNRSVANITLDGIRLAHYTGEPGVGLLIAQITDSTDFNFIGITTKNYGPDVQAAAALIGKAGSENAANVRLTFRDMQVEDERGKLFAYASYIYHYNTTADADLNKSMVLYTFKKEDAESGNVTYGDELRYGVDYYDCDRDEALQNIVDEAKTDFYNPYVYEVKNILVNPKNGNFLEGCGTYEDPYIIRTRKQFLTLYAYLTGSSAYTNVFNTLDVNGKRWSVNQYAGGSADGRCNLTDASDSHMAVEFNNNLFPKRNEMAEAYYVIAADIDLSDYSDLNEYVMSQDFAGFGTSAVPFRGALIGQKADGTAPIITFPNVQELTGQITYQANYGLVQCMKGAVIKNLVLQGDDIRVSTNGGSVAAIVLGGDNIIEDVTVNVGFTIMNNVARCGGYVGRVKKGSVILRGMTKENLETLQIGYADADGNRIPVTKENHDNFLGVGRAIGMVEDGCAIYESKNGSITSNVAVLEQTDFGFVDAGEAGLPFSYSFPILNGDYLEANGRVTVTGSAENGFHIQMDNAAQMEIATIALNSGAFTIYNSGASDVNHYNGYDYTAVCRKADYTDVGCGVLGRDGSVDFQKAVTRDDNVYYYPYLYDKYFDFSQVSEYQGRGGYEATQRIEGAKRLSLMNWSKNLYGDIGNVVNTYELMENTVYDMTVYGRAFRGFGALYPALQLWLADGGRRTIPLTPTSVTAIFKANFDGHGATLKLDMTRDWDSDVASTGLFNYLIGYREGGFSIKNITIENSRFFSPNGDYRSFATGAFAGYVKGCWEFENLVLQRTEANAADYDVSGESFTGGLVGAIDYISTSEAYMYQQQVSFTNCQVQGTESTPVQIKGNTSIGGLAGYVNGNAYTANAFYFGTILITNCHVEHTCIQGKSETLEMVGGFIGKVGDSPGRGNINFCSKGIVTVTQQENDTEPAISNVTLRSDRNGSCSMGGLIGEYIGYYANSASYEGGKNLTISHVQIEDLNLISSGTEVVYYGLGGLCGSVWDYCTNIEDVTVSNAAIGYGPDSAFDSTKQRMIAGGLVGCHYSVKLQIADVKVEDSRIVSNGAVGGFLGVSRDFDLTLTTRNRTENEVVNTVLHSVNNSAAGAVGSTYNTPVNWKLENIRIWGCQIWSDKVMTNNRDFTASAGGILAMFYQSSNSRYAKLEIGNITVGGKTEIKATSAGGVVGAIYGTNIAEVLFTGDIRIGCQKDEWGNIVEDTEYTSVYGCREVGGLYGYNYYYGVERSSADIRIQRTRIGGCSMGDVYTYVGGIGGIKYFFGVDEEATYIYDSVVVKDCLIVGDKASSATRRALILCGGLYGSVARITNVNREECRAYFYHPWIINTSIGYANGLATTLEDFKKLDAASDSVHIVTGPYCDTSDYWRNLDINENNTVAYSRYIGNYFGEIGVSLDNYKQIYILRPELHYDEDFTGSRPAVDVGLSIVRTQDNSIPYGKGHPYDYRDSVHIVYFNPDQSKMATDFMDNELLGDIGTDEYEDEYLYSTIDDVVAAYDSKADGREFLDSYRLNMLLGTSEPVLDYYNRFCAAKTIHGVPVVFADGGTAQNIVDSVMAILTNVGGVSEDPTDENMRRMLTVSAKKAKITADGRIVADEDRDYISLSVADNKISYRELVYDGINEDDSYTVTLLCFRYGVPAAEGGWHYETAYVPVFVVERIAYYSKLSVMEGEQYSLKAATGADTAYTGEVTVAHDSTYTIFVELAYGEGRKKNSYKNVVVNKTITFQKATGTDMATGEYTWGDTTIPAGMKFTLVEADTGKVYYYTQPQERTTDIDFTRFVDAEGNPYQNRRIGDIKTSSDSYQYGEEDLTGFDMGLERFYLYMDPRNVDTLENAIFKISITTEETEPAIKEFLDRTEDKGIQITWMPGLDISFEGKGTGGETAVSGKISRDERIVIDTRIRIAASDIYWAEKANASSSFIDSENSNKYLDVAVRLFDRNSGEYVNLPEGTNVIIGTREPYVPIGQSVLYTYKNQSAVFPIGKVSGDVSGDSSVSIGAGVQVKNSVHMELDFSVADISEYIGNTYDVYLELRRSSDPDYPLGGTRVDYYADAVTGEGSQELAVALEIEDLMDLGINTYQETAYVHEIPFLTKLDFSEMIRNDKEADITDCAKNRYLVTYRLKKKVSDGAGAYHYEYVGSGDVAVPDCGLRLGDTLRLATVEADADGDIGDDSGQDNKVYRDLQLVTCNGTAAYRMVKTFTESEIKAGTHGIKYLTDWEMSLFVDTEGMADTDLSNYCVEVTLLPFSTEEPPQDDSMATLTDYYIFTIGKIKTDM